MPPARSMLVKWSIWSAKRDIKRKRKGCVRKSRGSNINGEISEYGNTIIEIRLSKFSRKKKSKVLLGISRYIKKIERGKCYE